MSAKIENRHGLSRETKGKARFLSFPTQSLKFTGEMDNSETLKFPCLFAKYSEGKLKNFSKFFSFPT